MYHLKGKPTIDGAGVKLYRVFGGTELAQLLDPFLLLDHFGSRYPHEYLMGFPWHPHRGIETVTYLIKGEVHHADSTGTRGILKNGDVQWMTAGSGIFHEEMPKSGKIKQGNSEIEDPEVNGLQLWVNLPKDYKMIQPKYRNIDHRNIPIVTLDDGTIVKLIAGGSIKAPGYGIVEGPVNDLTVPVVYLDVYMRECSEFIYRVRDGYTTFAYVMEGSAIFDQANNTVNDKELVVYSREGAEVHVRTNDKPVRFLLLSGKPIGDPIAWYGPIVMNTWDEILKAFEELKRGTFVKHQPTVRDL